MISKFGHVTVSNDGTENERIEQVQRLLREKVQQCFAREVSNVRRSLRVGKPGVALPESYLSSVVENMATTRSSFMKDAGQFLTLICVLFAGSGLVAAQAYSTSGAKQISLWIAAIGIVATVFPVVNALHQKARAVYEFYVAAVIHAAIVHAAVSLDRSHPWFDYVYRDLEGLLICDLPKCVADGHFVAPAVEKDWRQALMSAWVRTSSAWEQQRFGRIFHLFGTTPDNKGLNLLQSFERLLSLAERTALVALVLGLVFAFLSYSPESEGSTKSEVPQAIDSKTDAGEVSKTSKSPK